MSLWSWPGQLVRRVGRERRRHALVVAERHFTQALLKPGRAQAELLLQILRHQARCAYGRDHHFSAIGGMRDFQRRVL